MAIGASSRAAISQSQFVKTVNGGWNSCFEVLFVRTHMEHIFLAIVVLKYVWGTWLGQPVTF